MYDGEPSRLSDCYSSLTDKSDKPTELEGALIFKFVKFIVFSYSVSNKNSQNLSELSSREFEWTVFINRLWFILIANISTKRKWLQDPFVHSPIKLLNAELVRSFDG